VFGCIKTFSVIRKTRRKRKRRTQCGGWSMWRKTRIVAVWHFLPSPVTFFILLRMNANNKKTGNKGAHPSHSPKCVFVCVRACMYSSPFFFWGGSRWLEDCIQEYISHSVARHEFWVSAETWLSSIYLSGSGFGDDENAMLWMSWPGHDSGLSLCQTIHTGSQSRRQWRSKGLCVSE
jgi:hypothetical protein